MPQIKVGSLWVVKIFFNKKKINKKLVKNNLFEKIAKVAKIFIAKIRINKIASLGTLVQ